MTGVTTVVKTLDHDPSNLLKWSAKTQLVGAADYIEGALQADPSSLPLVLGLLRDPDAAWRELDSRGLTFNHVRDRAAKKGTNIHVGAFEALARGAAFPDLDGMTEEEIGLCKAVQKFFVDHNPKFELVEQIVASDRLGVAGRLDGYGTLPGFEDPVVVDLKTGNFLSAAAHAQVGGGYPLLLKESGYIPEDQEPPRGLFLQVKADGSYELIPAEATPTDFEVAVLTYRSAGRINSSAYKAKKARQENTEKVPV